MQKCCWLGTAPFLPHRAAKRPVTRVSPAGSFPSYDTFCRHRTDARAALGSAQSATAQQPAGASHAQDSGGRLDGACELWSARGARHLTRQLQSWAAGSGARLCSPTSLRPLPLHSVGPFNVIQFS